MFVRKAEHLSKFCVDVKNFWKTLLLQNFNNIIADSVSYFKKEKTFEQRLFIYFFTKSNSQNVCFLNADFEYFNLLKEFIFGTIILSVFAVDAFTDFENVK